MLHACVFGHMMGLFKKLKLLTYEDNVISVPRMFKLISDVLLLVILQRM